jgi:hypothetical protein
MRIERLSRQISDAREAYIKRKSCLILKKVTMRQIIVVLSIALMIGAGPRGGGRGGGGISRGGGGARPAVGNRSAGGANFNRGNVNRANVGGGNVNRANVNRGNVNRGNVNRGNINSGNVNRNFNNANINRNTNVNGWGNHYAVDDNHWGWGSFAGAGAAAAVTGAAVGAAMSDNNTTNVVQAPGTVVTSLPPGCSEVPGTTMYDCGGTQYQPAFDGSDLVYEAH